jgi:hypothetical protein
MVIQYLNNICYLVSHLCGIRYDNGGRKTEGAVADVAPETNVVALTAQVSSCKQNFINFASELTN